MHIEPLTGSIGAAVTELDLRALDDGSFATLLEAWYEHLVLFFPGQHLDPAEQRDFARRFGDLEVHPLTEKLEGVPEVTLLHSERGGRADVWHTDVVFVEQPPIAAVLQQISAPPTGGDTMWSNQYRAYESLSAPMRDLVDGLTAVHSAWSQGRPEIQAERPVVLTHPVTGRRALAVNRLFPRRIPQLTLAESDALLATLYERGESLEFTVRWRWSPGDVVIWDNRCTRHYAIGDYDDERVMHRVTVLGQYEGPASAARWPDHDLGRLSASSAATIFR